MDRPAGPSGVAKAIAPLVAIALLAGAAACGRPDTPTITPEATASDVTTGAPMTLTSPAVADGRLLPAFRCEPKVNGTEASIPLAWSGVPAGTASLAIAMHHHPDPAREDRVNGYLEVWGIPPTVTALAHGAADDGPWLLGANKDGVAISYTSPCSKAAGTHTYIVELFALAETPASLPTQSSLDVTYPVMAAAVGRVPVLATATLTFTDTAP